MREQGVTHDEQHWERIREFQPDNGDIVVVVSRTRKPYLRYSYEIGVRTPTGQFGRFFHAKLNAPDTLRRMDSGMLIAAIEAAEDFIQKELARQP